MSAGERTSSRIAVAEAVDYAVTGLRGQSRVNPDNFEVAAAVRLTEIWSSCFIKEQLREGQTPPSFKEALIASRDSDHNSSYYMAKIRVRIPLLKDGQRVLRSNPTDTNPYETFRQTLPYPTTPLMDYLRAEENRVQAALDSGLHPQTAAILKEAKKGVHHHAIWLHSYARPSNFFGGGERQKSVVGWLAGKISDIEGFVEDPDRDFRTAEKLLSADDSNKWLSLPFLY